jgi:hypothetical protein
LATLALVVLVYAAMSGSGEDAELLEAAAASGLFIRAAKTEPATGKRIGQGRPTSLHLRRV